MDGLDASNLGKGKVIEKDKNEIFLSKEEIESKHIYFFLKRIIDVLGSCVGLLALLPLFMIVAYKIKKEDPEVRYFFHKSV